jgi:hypothetical protein
MSRSGWKRFLAEGDHAIGCFALMDRRPRSFTERQINQLETLAAQARYETMRTSSPISWVFR